MWWLLGLVGLTLSGWVIFSTVRILYPERHSLSKPTPAPARTEHTLTALDGAQFTVWRLSSPSPRAHLLLCHGYYANRHQVLELAHQLREHHYDVVLFELRGHGDRPGPCTLGIKERQDARVILEWLTRDQSQALPIGVLGFSLGAAVLCQVVADHPRIRAVVTDSVYSRLFPIIQRVMWQRYHIPPFPLSWLTWWSVQIALCTRLGRLDPAALAPQLHQPLLAIQGGEDQRVPSALGQEFYQRWAGSKEQWCEPSAGHVGTFALQPQVYCDRVATFFDRAFSQMTG